MGNKVVIFGHGGFNPAGGQYAREVLVPPDTTLRFFSDTGQALTFPVVFVCGACQRISESWPCTCGELNNYRVRWDVERIANVWEQFAETRAPLSYGQVTYNFFVSPPKDEEYDLATKAKWGVDDVVLSAEQQLYLCTGTAETCPTPALLVQQRQSEEEDSGVPIVEAQRWWHHCDGILGNYDGDDLFWLACTSLVVPVPDLPALLTTTEPGPGRDPIPEDWLPDNIALTLMERRNDANLAAITVGGTVSIAVAGIVVLIGEDHNEAFAVYLRRYGDELEQGQLRVLDDNVVQIEGIKGEDNKQEVASTLKALGKTVEGDID